MRGCHVVKVCMVTALTAIGTGIGLDKAVVAQSRARLPSNKGCTCWRADRCTRHSLKP